MHRRVCVLVVAVAMLAGGLVAGPVAAKTPSVTKVSAAEAAKHKLPGANIELVLVPSGLSVSRLLGRQTYISASGPPGGPHGLALLAYRAAGQPTRAFFDRLLASWTKQPGLELGKVETLKILGRRRTAIAYAVGAGPAREQGCVVLHTPPTGKRTHGVALRFWSSAGKTLQRCAAQLKLQPYRAIHSLSVELR